MAPFFDEFGYDFTEGSFEQRHEQSVESLKEICTKKDSTPEQIAKDLVKDGFVSLDFVTFQEGEVCPVALAVFQMSDDREGFVQPSLSTVRNLQQSDYMKEEYKKFLVGIKGNEQGIFTQNTCGKYQRVAFAIVPIIGDVVTKEQALSMLEGVSESNRKIYRYKVEES